MTVSNLSEYQRAVFMEEQGFDCMEVEWVEDEDDAVDEDGDPIIHLRTDLPVISKDEQKAMYIAQIERLEKEKNEMIYEQLVDQLKASIDILDDPT